MKFFPSSFKPLLLLLLSLAALALAGCGSTNPDNASVRPWDSPANWETGALPSTINQGR